MSPTLSPGLLPRAGPSAELAPCRTLATLGVVLVAAAQTDWSFTFVVILTITARTRAWIRAEGGRAVDVIGRSVAKRRAFCRNGTLLHACPPGGSTCVGELGPSSPRKRECAVPRERPRASTFPPRTNQLPDHARARRPASADWQSVSRNGVRNGVHVPLSWREFSPSVQHSHSLPRPHALRLLPGKGTTSSLPGDFLEVELCRAEVPTTNTYHLSTYD